MSKFISTMEQEVTLESVTLSCDLFASAYVTEAADGEMSPEAEKKREDWLQKIWEKIVELAMKAYNAVMALIKKVKDFLEPLRETIFDKELVVTGLHFPWDTMDFHSSLERINKVWVQLQQNSKKRIYTEIIDANLSAVMDEIEDHMNNDSFTYKIRSADIAYRKLNAAENAVKDWRYAVDKMYKDIRGFKIFHFPKYDVMKNKLGKIAAQGLCNIQLDIGTITQAIKQKSDEKAMR